MAARAVRRHVHAHGSIIMLVLVWVVPQYNCNSGSTPPRAPTDADITLPRAHPPATERVGSTKRAWAPPKDDRGALYGRVRHPFLFALPRFLGRQASVSAIAWKCSHFSRRVRVAGAWCMAMPDEGGGGDEDIKESVQTTPLSQWLAEFEKDFADMPQAPPEGSSMQEQGWEKTAQSQTPGLSLDWDRSSAASESPRQLSAQGRSLSAPGQDAEDKRISPSDDVQVPGTRGSMRTGSMRTGGEPSPPRAWQVVRQQKGGVRNESEGPGSGRWVGSKTTRVLRDLPKFKQLEQLLQALEPFVDAPDGVMTAPQAVAAMNHLKRLASKEKIRGKNYPRGVRGVAERLSMSSMRAGPDRDTLAARVDRCMRANAGVVNRGMYRLTAKHVALALNAVRDRDVLNTREYKELFRTGAKRVQQLAAAAVDSNRLSAKGANAPVRGGAGASVETFDSQNIANIVNAFATARVRNVELFQALAVVAVQLRPLEYTPQAVAIILNAYARAEVLNRPLFDFLALAALGLDPSLFSAQHVANIANAFAKANYRDEMLFKYLSATAQAIPANAYSLQAVANILGAFSHFGVRDEPLYAYLGAALRSDVQEVQAAMDTSGSAVQQVQALGAATLGNIVKSLARAQYADEKLFRSLSSALVRLPSSSFDALAVSDIVSAWALYYDQKGPDPLSVEQDQRTAPGEEEALLRHMSAVALMICVKGGRDGALGEAAGGGREDSDSSFVSNAVLLLPAFGKCLEVTGLHRPYGPVRYWLNELFRQYAIRLRDQDGECFSVPDIAALAAIFARRGPPYETSLFQFLSSVLRQIPADMLDAQGSSSALATIANAFTRVLPDDDALFRHLETALVLMSPSAFDAQSLALACNAFARRQTDVGKPSAGRGTAMSRAAALVPARLRTPDPQRADRTGQKALLGFNNKTGAANVDGAKLRLSVLYSDSVIDGFNPPPQSASAREFFSEFQLSLDALSETETYTSQSSAVPDKRDMLFQGVRKIDSNNKSSSGGGGGGGGGSSGSSMAIGPSDDELKLIWDSFAMGAQDSGGGAQTKGPERVGDRGMGKGRGAAGSVFDFFAEVVLEIEPAEFDAQTQALLANALVKCVARSDVQLSAALAHLAVSILSTDVAKFDDQNVANIVKAYSRANTDALGVPSTSSSSSSPAAVDVQTPAKSRGDGRSGGASGERTPTLSEEKKRSVLLHMAAATVALPPRTIGPQAVANLLNGFAGAGWEEDGVIRHLASAALGLAKGSYTPGEVAMSLQALAVLHLPESPLVPFFSRAASLISADRWSPEETANLAWSCAVLRLSDKALLLTICDALARNLIGTTICRYVDM
eukprot:Tamp_01586.p1 GENE.Tamp_01586~~Tamp_01586.p1  ORF type:complete len:1335 (-),score=286.37 Tamp_01586:390-4394(-)